MDSTTIIQIECKGKNVKLVKEKNHYRILHTEKNDLDNVHFLKNHDALVVFNEQVETII